MLKFSVYFELLSKTQFINSLKYNRFNKQHLIFAPAPFMFTVAVILTRIRPEIITLYRGKILHLFLKPTFLKTPSP